MKRIFLLLFIQLFIFPIYAEQSIVDNLDNPAEEEAVIVSPAMKIMPITQHESDEQSHYVLDIKYPQMEGKLTEGAKQFNQVINKVINEEIQQFKKNVALDAAHMKACSVE